MLYIEKQSIAINTGMNKSLNFNEKYLPIAVQRQINQMMEYCFPEKLTKRRIHWYNEIKIPQLSIALLVDEGTNFLDERIDELKKITDAYPEIVLGEEIDKLHFQDASAKQTMKDLVE